MKSEPSKLPRLLTAYYEKFQRHVPESALHKLNAGELAVRLQESLASGEPISEVESEAPLVELGLRVCILRERGLEGGTPRKRLNGEWLQ